MGVSQNTSPPLGAMPVFRTGGSPSKTHVIDFPCIYMADVVLSFWLPGHAHVRHVLVRVDTLVHSGSDMPLQASGTVGA